MSKSLNKVQLIGNLGDAPEMKPISNERKRVTFSVYTNKSYTNREGEQVTKAQRHNVVLWSPLASVARYLEKGSRLYVEGELTTRSYEDSMGVKKYITEVVGREIILLGRKSVAEEEKHQNENSVNVSGSDADDEKGSGSDELPF